MPQFSPIPVFVKGEPGFADKLNELGKVLAEVVEHVNACPAPVKATAPRKAATSK